MELLCSAKVAINDVCGKKKKKKESANIARQSNINR